jgi:ribokinase
MGYISVLGIFVADISFSGNKIPSIGETILGNSYNIGGKVNFISKIGKDDYGQLALNTLDQNKIDTSAIIQSQNQQTGVAGIMVDKKTGKNAINVITGAASTLTINEVNKNIDKIKNSKIFLTQLEIPKDVTLYSLKIAKENKVLTILNPAPASKISKEFFNYIDYFTPNETEAEFYTGIKITNEKEAKEASIKLLNIGLKRVIITLGEKGLFYSDGKEEIYLKATQVKAIDTTGAGDAFNGGLAYALSQNKSIKDSLNLANQVAGLSTLKLGAGNAMPLLSDLG